MIHSDKESLYFCETIQTISSKLIITIFALSAMKLEVNQMNCAHN